MTNYCTKQRSCWLAQSVGQRKGHPVNFQLTNNQTKMAPFLKIFKILRFLKDFGRFWPRIGKKFNKEHNFHISCSILFQTVISAISVHFLRSRKIIGPKQYSYHDMVLPVLPSFRRILETESAQICVGHQSMTGSSPCHLQASEFGNLRLFSSSYSWWVQCTRWTQYALGGLSMH